MNGRRVILDVAHNPAAASVLAASLTPIAGRYTAVASVLDDKDWRGIIQPLRGIIAEWRIAEIGDSDRATKAQTLHEELYNEGLKGALFASLEEAFDNAIAEAGEDDTVVVFGSFHTVTAVLNMQRQRDGCVI